MRRVPTEYVEPAKPKLNRHNLHISDKKLVFSTNPHVLSNSTELILNNAWIYNTHKLFVIFAHMEVCR